MPSYLMIRRDGIKKIVSRITSALARVVPIVMFLIQMRNVFVYV